MPPPIPIVDSHIHLFPESHLPTLTWYTPSNPGPLGSQHSVDQYRQATREAGATASTLRGFIFLETDRLSSVEEPSESGAGGAHGWTHALDEVSLLARIAAGKPVPGEGHSAEDRGLCLGIVPWAPVPGGPGALEKYMALVRERAGAESAEVWGKIRGVRYLVQDKPAGVMLQPDFIEGLKWLGRQGLTFDLGVDARQGGIWQLEEAVEMMRRVYKGVEEKDRVTIVINHMCKPNLRLESTTPVTTHPDFLQWKAQVTAMAQHPTAYMKLSGAFSELPSLSPDFDPDIASLVEKLQPWTDVVFDAFGPERVMFGSDWPVCNVGGGGNKVTWGRWSRVVQGVLDQRGLDEDQRRGFWGGVAVKAYGVTI
ncbi:hypothetical protein ASPVEDRAFT_72367 [Aspergillus versicolor CBS 583.65]|uniref:Amidohydrolase-related domain-containing protein n=1 Tax=Aspergillus versicolor CBS 583.65 TaxID=1036611 RepID=A0A1L9PM71_ASPVE|nr:uncharacterized protein ASPVEDRAFT_72367 [Aspergillus versicolor CBS 583.65]OJJ02536.1 hypothetical protein ASPVEDRAFT_72367 [Aspergillus versicolor CBS 583.65]